MKADPNRLNESIKGFIGGFVSTGQTSAKGHLSQELDNTVMLFDSEQEALAAADILATEEFGTSPDNIAVEIKQYRAARAHVNPGEAGMFHSWIAVGRYVIATYLYDNVMSTLKTHDSEKLATRAEKSISKISAGLKDYSPPRLDTLMDSDIDLDGMLGLALPTVGIDGAQRGIPGVYTRHGGLHISGSPESDAKLFEETGVDRISWQGDFVYRARDAQGAQQIAEEHGQVSKFFRRVESPKNLPNALCKEYIGPPSYAVKFYCSVSYGRYSAEVAASQLKDVHQRVSAQYSILAKSK